MRLAAVLAKIFIPFLLSAPPPLLLNQFKELSFIRPQPAYYVEYMGLSSDDETRLHNAVKAWNNALGKDDITFVKDDLKANIIVTSWPGVLYTRTKDGLSVNYADSWAVPMGQTCLIRMSQYIPNENIEETMAHELGHCLGLAHRDGCIMTSGGFIGGAIIDQMSVSILKLYNPNL